MAGKIDHREQEVANFASRRRPVSCGNLGLDLVCFLANLGQHRERIIPIEANSAGFSLQFERPSDGRERHRDAGEGGRHLLTRSRTCLLCTLLVLDLLP
jgi:hypothetical protein